MFCLSKGLGAPVGSILAGPASFIEEALRVRKRLGGGMRQVGVLAAAGIVALTDQVERLDLDHRMARQLAHRVAGMDGLRIDPGRVQTNIIIFEVTASGMTAPVLAERWKESGVLCLVADEHHLRAVTHYEVTPVQVDEAADRLAAILAGA
jgi:threonine aldolase